MCFQPRPRPQRAGRRLGLKKKPQKEAQRKSILLVIHRRMFTEIRESALGKKAAVGVM